MLNVLASSTFYQCITLKYMSVDGRKKKGGIHDMYETKRPEYLSHGDDVHCSLKSHGLRDEGLDFSAYGCLCQYEEKL
jgi:hypothetical protein